MPAIKSMWPLKSRFQYRRSEPSAGILQSTLHGTVVYPRAIAVLELV